MKRPEWKQILLGSVVGALLVGGALVWWNTRPLTRAEADRLSMAAFERAASAPERSNAALLIYDARSGHRVEARAPDARAAFHTASVGKLFTTALIGRLLDRGQLRLETRVAEVLPREVLRGLFVYQGRDYAAEVTVWQLLSHTSGLADFFEDRAADGSSGIELMISQPGRRWSPPELLDYHRRALRAVGRPGAQFHYSDSGFFLLGLIVEQRYGRPFHEVVRQEIARPLKLRRTWMPFRDHPEQPTDLGPLWLEGVEFSQQPALSADWSGGGIASTPDELVTFARALFGGQLVSRPTLERLMRFDHRFIPGLAYGGGLTEYRFEEFMPLLRGYPRLQGHMGVLGVQLFYDAEQDTTYVLNLGSSGAAEASVRLMIELVGLQQRVR